MKSKSEKLPPNYSVWIPHAMYHELMFRKFSSSELVIILLIIRFQVGYSVLKKSKLKQSDFECCGLAASTVSESLKKLQSEQVVVLNESFYFINRNSSEWLTPKRVETEHLANFEALLAKHNVFQKAFISENRTDVASSKQKDASFLLNKVNNSKQSKNYEEDREGTQII